MWQRCIITSNSAVAPSTKNIPSAGIDLVRVSLRRQAFDGLSRATDKSKKSSPKPACDLSIQEGEKRARMRRLLKITMMQRNEE
jgi:hypothetical protein